MGIVDRRELGRLVVPVLAAAAAVVAVIIDPSSTWRTLLLIAMAVVVGLSSFDLPLVPVTLVAAVGTSVAVWSGQLEPGLFLLSVLGLLVAWSDDSVAVRVSLVVLLLAAPLVIIVAGPGSDDISPIWFLGIGFPVALGASMRREFESAAALAEARVALAEAALTEERRRIARDVHDLVGHGLAVALVQIASARHVLRRDVEAADEALVAAERAGRTSMRELRATLAMLRDGDRQDVSALPAAADIETLVEQSRADGLGVTYRVVGDTHASGGGTGLALYRIAQEALANAQRHAPGAATEVTLECGDDAHRLRVLSRGARVTSPDRPTFGIRGMEERAAGVGGSLSAGTTPEGWLVEATIPAAHTEEDA